MSTSHSEILPGQSVVGIIENKNKKPRVNEVAGLQSFKDIFVTPSKIFLKEFE